MALAGFDHGSGLGRGKADRLFRAAISAFCALPRPSRQEIIQIEDLAMPLFDGASKETLRYVSAALSKCDYPPATLVKRLCNQPVEIAAPLLMHSSALSNIDLIALIGRHGMPHAMAIRRRADLDPRIADLIRALTAAGNAMDLPPAPDELGEVVAKPIPQTAPSSSGSDEIRLRLRDMMRPSSLVSRTLREGEDVSPYIKLRNSALTGMQPVFETTIADMLDVSQNVAASIMSRTDATRLVLALKFLSLSAEEAFLVACAIDPARFPHARSVNAFIETFAHLSDETIARQLREWKADTLGWHRGSGAR